MALQEELESQGNWLFRYRSFLPLLILVAGWGMYLRRVLHPEEFPLFVSKYELYYWIVAMAVGLLGLLVRVYTVGYSPKNTSGRNTKVGQVADVLNQTGIYSLVRHPLYLGNFLMWLDPHCSRHTCGLYCLSAFCIGCTTKESCLLRSNFLEKSLEKLTCNGAIEYRPFYPISKILYPLKFLSVGKKS